MSPRRDQKIAELLAPGESPAEAPLTEVERREAIDVVRAALLKRARTGSVAPAWRRWPMVAGALAAATILGVFAVMPRDRNPNANDPNETLVERGAARVQRHSDTHLVEPGARIAAGSVVQTSASDALLLRLHSGSTVELSGEAELTLVSVHAHQHFSLSHGHFGASVVKLQPGEQFVVNTARGRVEVWGTEFTVDVQRDSPNCPGGSTRTTVIEGIVSVSSVQGDVRLRAGESHELPCLAPVPPPALAPQPLIGAMSKRPPEDSSLVQMNALYEAALNLKRDGALKKAADGFRLLREKYPRGPLDEAATIEEMRALEQLGSPRAHDVARQYLMRYPRGYGRDDAERLVTPIQPTP